MGPGKSPPRRAPTYVPGLTQQRPWPLAQPQNAQSHLPPNGKVQTGPFGLILRFRAPWHSSNLSRLTGYLPRGRDPASFHRLAATEATRAAIDPRPSGNACNPAPLLDSPEGGDQALE